MMGDVNMVRVADRAGKIAQDANAVYWFSCEDSCDDTERHLRRAVDEMFRELAAALGYAVEKRDPLASIAETVGDI
jgi:hypothetical protein